MRLLCAAHRRKNIPVVSAMETDSKDDGVAVNNHWENAIDVSYLMNFFANTKGGK